MYSWEYAVIDAYKELTNKVNWDICPVCKEYPRIWEFDNGRFAKCRCQHMYDAAPVSAESIMSVYKATGSTLEYDWDQLRVNWNEHVEEQINENSN